MIIYPKRYSKKTIAILVSLSFALIPIPAKAACVLTVAAFTAAELVIAAAIEAYSLAVETDLELIIEAIDSGNESTVNAINGLTKGQAAGQGKALDVVAKNQALSAQTQTQIKVEHEHSIRTLPNPCSTMGTAKGSGVAISGSQDFSRANHQTFTNLQSKISNSDADLLSRYKDYGNTYSWGKDQENADIQAASLLAGGGTRRPAAMDRQMKRSGVAADNPSGTPIGDSNTFSETQEKSARQFILNATRIATVEDISDEAAKTAEGRRFRMMMREEQARNSLALKSMADALAIRTNVPGIANSLGGDSWKTTAKTLNPNRVDDKVSYLDLLTTEVDRRQANSDWHDKIGGSSPQEVAKEEVFMDAFELRLRLEQLKKLEKIELLLAQTSLNAVADSVSRQKLEQQRARVTGR